MDEADDFYTSKFVAEDLEISDKVFVGESSRPLKNGSMWAAER